MKNKFPCADGSSSSTWWWWWWSVSESLRTSSSILVSAQKHNAFSSQPASSPRIRGQSCNKVAATSNMIVLLIHHKRGVLETASCGISRLWTSLKAKSYTLLPSGHRYWILSWGNAGFIRNFDREPICNDPALEIPDIPSCLFHLFHGGLKGLSRIYILLKLRNFTVCNRTLCSCEFCPPSWGSGMRACDDHRLNKMIRKIEPV